MKALKIIGLITVLILIAALGCNKAVEKTEVTEPVTEPVITEPEAVEPVVPAGADIQILRGGFDPETVTVAVGSTVTWKNMDTEVHLLTVSTDRSPRLEGKIEATEDEEAKGGDSWDKTFEEAGTYEVFDAIFKFKGTIIVE